MSNPRTVETDDKPETSTQFVYQSFSNTSTNAFPEGTFSETSKETESKEGTLSDVNDTVKSSSNVSISKASKETNSFKRPLDVDKVKPKKSKEVYDQNSKGKNEASRPKPDSLGYGLKVPPLKIVIPTTDANTVIKKTNGKKEQKVSRTRISRSSNRRGTSSSIPKEQLAQTNSSSAVTAYAVSTNECPAPRPKPTIDECIIIISDSDDEEQVLTTASTSTATTTASTSTATTTASTSTATTKASTSTATTKAFTSTATTKASTSTATKTSKSLVTAELSGMKLHPIRNKRKTSRAESKTSVVSSTANVTTVETNSSGTAKKPASVTSSCEMFLNLRKQIDKKHKNLFPVQPKPPLGFKDYLMNRRTYILAGNSRSRVVNTLTPSPANLHEQLKKLFVEQEKGRQSLRVQHIVEKEKLVLSVEQEILRVHGRAARTLANQPLPFSACTVLKDNEVYNMMTPEQEQENDGPGQSQYDGRLFLSWLQDVDDKWDKIKESMLLRHHNEAESLHAVQKMDWGWKLQELDLRNYSSVPKIDEEHVPMVLVSDDFDLMPA